MSDLARDLNSKYTGKILVLQTPYRGEHLSFDPDGSLLKGGSPGTWALAGNVVVAKVKIDGGKLEIEARRVYLDWNSELKHFETLPASRVRIEILFSQGGPAAAEVQRALAKVFYPATASDPMPSYWKPVLEHKFPAQPTTAAPIGDLEGKSVYSVPTKDVAPPVPIRTPDPPYTDEARRAGLTGVLTVAILVDAHGEIRDVIEVGKPLGLGLDQAAIETVQRWKLRPGEKNGVPVAALVGVEVSFRIP